MWSQASCLLSSCLLYQMFYRLVEFILGTNVVLQYKDAVPRQKSNFSQSSVSSYVKCGFLLPPSPPERNCIYLNLLTSMKTFTSDFELENSGVEFLMFCSPQVLQVVGIICAVVWCALSVYYSTLWTCQGSSIFHTDLYYINLLLAYVHMYLHLNTL